MAENHDSALGCTPGCAREGAVAQYGQPEPESGIGLLGFTNADIEAANLAVVKPLGITTGPPALGTGTLKMRPDLASGAGVPTPGVRIGFDAVDGRDSLDLGCGVTRNAEIGTLTVLGAPTPHTGPGNPFWVETTGTAGEPASIPWRWIDDSGGQPGGFTHQSNQHFHFEFDCPIDFVLMPGSMQGASEFVILTDGPDEAYGYPDIILSGGTGGQPAGVTAKQPREDIPDGSRYDDNNAGPTLFVWRQVTELDFRWQAQSNLTSFMQWFVVLAPDGVRPQPCQGSAFVVEDCSPTTTPRWRNGCAVTDPLPTAPPFFQDFAAGAPWEYSSDGGVTFVPAPASAPHGAGDLAGTHVWQQTFTVPAGYEGFWFVKIRGGPDNIHGTLLYDGAPMDDGFKHGTPYINPSAPNPSLAQVNGPGWSGGYVPVEPGTHTFQWLEGEHAAAGTTTPVILGALGAVLPIRDDIVIVECLDKTTGAVTSTRYETPDGATYTLLPNATATTELCEGCG